MAKKPTTKKPSPKRPAEVKIDPGERARRDFALIVERGAAAAPETFGRDRELDAYWDPIDAPAESPWRFPSNDAAAIIDEVFSPLKGRADGFIQALHASVRRVVVRRDEEGAFHLLYFLDRDHPQAQNRNDPNVRYTTLSGAAPTEAPSSLPAELRLFLSVHNGFGADGYAVDAIVPASEVRPLPAKPDASEVYCDEVGNRIVLLKNGTVADWDHETGEVTANRSFFGWLSTAFATRILDLDPWEFRDGPRFRK